MGMKKESINSQKFFALIFSKERLRLCGLTCLSSSSVPQMSKMVRQVSIQSNFQSVCDEWDEKKAFSDISQNFFALISSKENNLKKIENVWADMLVAKLKSNSLLFIFSLCKGGAQYAPWF